MTIRLEQPKDFREVERYIVVSEYGEGGAAAKIVLVKRR